MHEPDYAAMSQVIADDDARLATAPSSPLHGQLHGRDARNAAYQHWSHAELVPTPPMPLAEPDPVNQQIKAHVLSVILLGVARGATTISIFDRVDAATQQAILAELTPGQQQRVEFRNG